MPAMDQKIEDEKWMQAAVEIAAHGFPAPNPHVGCVLVKNGKRIGSGFHDYAGGPHAEVNALREAGTDARGATAYVTLEPCNHVGRTGACSEALIAAGVARVVYAVNDPNPRMEGGSIRLAQAGIEVAAGVLAKPAQEVNHRWLTAMKNKRPYVIAKLATSLDGQIALASGESKWITNEGCRESGRRLRAIAGALLVGKGTVIADDPELSHRNPAAKNEVNRYVLDFHREIPDSAKVFQGPIPGRRFVEPHLALPPDIPAKSRDWDAILAQLWELGETSVLIEGGGATVSGALIAGVVDEFHLYLAPKILGAGIGWSASVASDIARLHDPLKLNPEANVQIEQIEGDIHLIYSLQSNLE